jgi:hypothetical protein
MTIQESEQYNQQTKDCIKICESKLNSEFQSFDSLKGEYVFKFDEFEYIRLSRKAIVFLASK